MNADLIAAGLSPFAPETQNVRAGRLLLERIKELSEAREDFGFETTLSGRGHTRLLTEIRQSGYRVLLFFLWLPSADLAVERVANRVQQGGHNVTEDVVRLAQPHVIILHPGPINRGLEISSAVADGPYSVIMHQVTNGVAVRMALLYLLIQRNKAAEAGDELAPPSDEPVRVRTGAQA